LLVAGAFLGEISLEMAIGVVVSLLGSEAKEDRLAIATAQTAKIGGDFWVV
jgi:hypothetical protein